MSQATCTNVSIIGETKFGRFIRIGQPGKLNSVKFPTTAVYHDVCLGANKAIACCSSY